MPPKGKKTVTNAADMAAAMGVGAPSPEELAAARAIIAGQTGAQRRSTSGCFSSWAKRHSLQYNEQERGEKRTEMLTAYMAFQMQIEEDMYQLYNPPEDDESDPGDGSGDDVNRRGDERSDDDGRSGDKDGRGGGSRRRRRPQPPVPTRA